MIFRTSKAEPRGAILKTHYAKNSILLNCDQLFLVLNEGNIEFYQKSLFPKTSKKSTKDNEKNVEFYQKLLFPMTSKESTVDMVYAYRKPYLQINYEQKKLSARSLYFVEGSTNDFYRSVEDKNEGTEEVVSLSLEELTQKLCNPTDFDSFYIINKEAKLLTAINLIDGVVKKDFNVQKAIRKGDHEDTSYDYMMIASQNDQIHAKYFSIHQKENGLTLKTQMILPISSFTIYDVVQESVNKRIEYSQESVLSNSKEKVPVKQKK